MPTSAQQVAGVERSPMLGTFYPDPYILVPPNFEQGVPYSQAGIFSGEMDPRYGPLSIFRANARPVQVYQRGFDGSLQAGPGIAIETPNLPGSAPVIYSTPTAYGSRFP